jgi:hypothetical protein
VTCPSFVASSLSACATPPATGSFPPDVAAVLAGKCQTCHASPPVNHAPFPLLTYEDVLKADSLCDGVPIWKAMHYVIQPDSVPHMPFGNAPQLTSSEFATLDAWLTGCAAPAMSITPDAGTPNTVIADQFNNRVIEVDPEGHIVWTFGDGTSVPGPTSVVAPNDAERLPNGQTLISGTGTGAGTEPACPADGGGCPDNRVLLVAADGGIAWEYDDDGGLSSPVCAVMLPGGNVLVTDQGNQRIIEVTPEKTIAWQYLPLVDGGPALNNPNSAERLANGNTLIADENNGRVLEVSDAGVIQWQYAQTPDAGPLSGVAFASRLSNGNTLITDSGNNRILEVTSAGAVVWSYYTASRSTSGTAPVVDGGSQAPNPTRAVRLASGNTLISDQFNDQVIEVNQAGQVVASYGALNDPAATPGHLNGPYDAKRVGDYTGLTPPQ